MSSTTTEQLKEQVQRVARARLALQNAQQSLAEVRNAFDADNRILIDAVKGNAAEVDAAEDALRALTLANFERTGEKKPVAGVEVKERNTLSYSPDEAMSWARETKMALKPESLDVKAFEKIAKATDLPFVAVIVEPQVNIASDLTKTIDVEVAA